VSVSSNSVTKKGEKVLLDPRADPKMLLLLTAALLLHSAAAMHRRGATDDGAAAIASAVKTNPAISFQPPSAYPDPTTAPLWIAVSSPGTACEYSCHFPMAYGHEADMFDDVDAWVGSTQLTDCEKLHESGDYEISKTKCRAQNPNCWFDAVKGICEKTTRKTCTKSSDGASDCPDNSSCTSKRGKTAGICTRNFGEKDVMKYIRDSKCRYCVIVYFYYCGSIGALGLSLDILLCTDIFF